MTFEKGKRQNTLNQQQTYRLRPSLVVCGLVGGCNSAIVAIAATCLCDFRVCCVSRDLLRCRQGAPVENVRRIAVEIEMVRLAWSR